MRKWILRLMVVLGSVGVAACGERLESGAACPILCSGQTLELRDTVLEAVAIDTTLAGFPPRGASNFLLLANSGDTVESRYVVRFDSLPSTYLKGTESVSITDLDSTYLRLVVDPSRSRFSAPVTFEVYDVNADQPDSATAALLPLFRSERLIGTLTLDSAAIRDSVRIFLSSDAVLAKIASNERLRLGIRVRSTAPVMLAVLSANTASFPRLGFDPAPADPEVLITTLVPRSRTPATDPRIAVDYTDYTISLGGQALPFDAVGVGGPTGRRVYYRFDLPARITDSTTVVRATLILHQRPAPTYGFSDSLVVASQVVVATREIVDLQRAVLLTDTVPGRSPPSIFALPSMSIPPAGAVERRFEIVNVVRFWRSTSAERVPQAIVLRSADEATSIREARFYSLEADPALRPRLLITYHPRSEFGIP